MQSDTLYYSPSGLITSEDFYFPEPGMISSAKNNPLLPPIGPSGSFITTKAHTKAFDYTESQPPVTDWIFWLIFAGFVLLTITKFYYEKRIGLLFTSVFSRSSLTILTREGSLWRHQSFIPLLIIYITSITLFLFEVTEYYNPGSSTGLSGLLLFVEIVGAYLLLFSLKVLVIRMTGWIFRNQQIAFEYTQNIFIINIFGGIILLPLILLINYSIPEVFIFIASGLLAILMLYRFVRGIAIGLSDAKFSLFHLFLYLCTLEILPLVIIAKFVSKYFFS